MSSKEKTPVFGKNTQTFVLAYKWLPDRIKGSDTPTQLRQDEPLLNLLSRFYRESQKKKSDSDFLEKEARSLSHTFGLPLWDEVPSLETWLVLAQRVATHLKLLRALEADGTRGFRSALKADWERLERRKPIETPEASAATPFTLRLRTTPGNLSRLEREELLTLEQIAVTEKGKSPKAIRTALADSLYNEFGGFFYLKRGHILIQTSGIQVECSADVWVGYLLSEVWRGGLRPRVCEGCRAFFVPRRDNQRYCVPAQGGRCEKRKQRSGSNPQLRSSRKTSCTYSAPMAVFYAPFRSVSPPMLFGGLSRPIRFI